jgi:hypothetical protein
MLATQIELASIIIALILSFSSSNPGYELPVIPSKLPDVIQEKNYNKLIPRKIWIAVKDRNDPLPGHMKDFLNRNSHWEKNICDNLCKEEFMNSVRN